MARLSASACQCRRSPRPATRHAAGLRAILLLSYLDHRLFAGVGRNAAHRSALRRTARIYPRVTPLEVGRCSGPNCRSRAPLALSEWWCRVSDEDGLCTSVRPEGGPRASRPSSCRTCYAKMDKTLVERKADLPSRQNPLFLPLRCGIYLTTGATNSLPPPSTGYGLRAQVRRVVCKAQRVKQAPVDQSLVPPA